MNLHTFLDVICQSIEQNLQMGRRACYINEKYRKVELMDRVKGNVAIVTG